MAPWLVQYFAQQLQELVRSSPTDLLDGADANGEVRFTVGDERRNRVATVRVEVTWHDVQSVASAARETHGDGRRLTPREVEIVQLLDGRLSNREIAERLSISEHTVRHHVEHVLAKLGAASRRHVNRLRGQPRQP